MDQTGTVVREVTVRVWMADGFTDADVQEIENALEVVDVGALIKKALYAEVDDKGEYALRLLRLTATDLW